MCIRHYQYQHPSPFSSRMPRSQLGCKKSQMIRLPPPGTQTSGCTWYSSSVVAQHFDQVSERLDNKTRTSWILPAQSIGLHTICSLSLRTVHLQASLSAERSSPGGIAAKHRSRYHSGKRNREVSQDQPIVGKVGRFSEQEHAVVDVLASFAFAASELALQTKSSSRNEILRH